MLVISIKWLDSLSSYDLIETSCHCVLSGCVTGPCKAPGYVLAIHSSKVLLVNQVAAPDYTLADTVIQLVMSQGRRHDVGVLLASHHQQTWVVSCLRYPTNPFSLSVCVIHVIVQTKHIKTVISQNQVTPLSCMNEYLAINNGGLNALCIKCSMPECFPKEVAMVFN